MPAAPTFALIVAGGSGTRMGSGIPKQFLLLNGRPVLMHTIEAFAAIPGMQLIVVLPAAQVSYWEALCAQYDFQLPHRLVAGGDTRFHSVRNGLETITDQQGLVAIHDGVRPVISKEVIGRTLARAAEKGNAIAAVKLKDSIREQALTGRTRNVNRNNYFLVQTPQVFSTALIKEAYGLATHYNFTDDAGVLEEVLRKDIHLVEGDYRNIKITTPEDLAVAEVFLR